MTIDESTVEFGGKAVKEYDPGTGLAEGRTAAYRLQVDWDQHENGVAAADLLATLLEDPNAAQLTAILFGDWGGTAEGNDSASVVEALVSAADKLSNLTALFLGDMTVEECEVSWIQQTDVSPLYGAFPTLEELRIRGSSGLRLGRLKHDRLRRLIIETGGLDTEVLAEVARADLPALEHLELWLGDGGYGWNGGIDDVMPLLSEPRFPKLAYLGLRNAEISDEIARAAASSPVVPRLEVLDLSLGTMSDDGAESLASSAAIKSLDKLDVHHNYITAAGVAKLGALGIRLIASDQQEADSDDDRYVAVSE